MSIRIWEGIARQKKQVENQRKEILNAFKQRKVADELGQVRAEKLFQPITKLLGKPREEKEEEKRLRREFPDYAMAGEDINYMHELPFAEEEDEDPYADLEPFEDDFPATESQAESEHKYEWDEIFPVIDKSSPESESPVPVKTSSSPGVSPGPVKSDPIPEPPRYSAATASDKPPKYRETRDDDSNDLSVLKKFLDKNQDNPNAIISTKKSKFYGMTVEEARYRVYDIYTERTKLVNAAGDRRSVIGQKGLGPYEGKSTREKREMIAAFERGKPQTKTQTGTGVNTLINRLSLGISSIFAGNTSLKLREEVRAIANMLHKARLISSEQKKKVLSLK